MKIDRPYTKFKDSMDDIYTVVVLGMDEDVSTVSFEDFDDAVEYCVEEIFDREQLDRESDEEYIRKELEGQMYYRGELGTYYIEEAKLVLK